MLTKLAASLGSYYPLLFLALVLCGPVLMVPHMHALFLCVAVVDSIFTVGAAGFVALMYLLHRYMPVLVLELTRQAADKVLGATLVEKISFYLYRLVSFLSTALLFTSLHPYFAAFGVLGHVTVTAARTLMARIHSPYR